MTEYPQVWIAKPVAARIGAVELAQRRKGRGYQSRIEVTPEVKARLWTMVADKQFGAQYERQAERAMRVFEGDAVETVAQEAA